MRAVLVAALAFCTSGAVARATVADGWIAASPREEIRPAFSFDPAGGRSGKGQLVITADRREGLDGAWTRSFPVTGDAHYRFRVYARPRGVAIVRRSVVAKLTWHDDAGRKVPTAEPINSEHLRLMQPMAEAEHPAAGEPDARGWIELTGVYHAPPRATQLAVELHLQWAPDATVAWSDITLERTATPSGRKVRLAAVHYRPVGGRDPAANRELFAPMIAEAARQKADLVVLGETVTYYGLRRTAHEVAEPVPGPSTEYFGELAKKHDLYIVLTVYERDRHLVYNTAVLLGPDGGLVGKYRKVTLPRSEIEAGVAPGHEYPVFQTRFGKLGMMICYDGFFPEVARELANRGAEVIAWPVWGCNILLARARACENQVYVVSSTYEDASSQWMRTGVFDHHGDLIATTEKWGTVAVAEVDLDRRTYWKGLGNFKDELTRHRPISSGETGADVATPLTHQSRRR